MRQGSNVFQSTWMWDGFPASINVSSAILDGALARAYDIARTRVLDSHLPDDKYLSRARILVVAWVTGGAALHLRAAQRAIVLA